MRRGIADESKVCVADSAILSFVTSFGACLDFID
jgi:hypothetical protein